MCQLDGPLDPDLKSHAPQSPPDNLSFHPEHQQINSSWHALTLGKTAISAILCLYDEEVSHDTWVELSHLITPRHHKRDAKYVVLASERLAELQLQEQEMPSANAN